MTANIEPASRHRTISLITLRILAVNLLALVFLAAGLLYVDEYRQGLINAELSKLQHQAQLFAAAVGETAADAELTAEQGLSARKSQQMIRRLVEASGSRARLFGADGALLADSLQLIGPGGMVRIEKLSLPASDDGLLKRLLSTYDQLIGWLGTQERLDMYDENAVQRATDYPEVILALSGEPASQVRATTNSGTLLSVAVPVQRYKRVLGVLMLTKSSIDVENAILNVRMEIIKWFVIALAVTVLLSLYLSNSIARPILLLSHAAERVRKDRHRRYSIPDFSERTDEIAGLAVSLREMTEALWDRVDEIERFAADVAHELKSPLTSLRSAVETVARVKHPEQQEKLLQIIQTDVHRLNRLISDISDASRLDAEMARSISQPVDIGDMLATLAEINGPTAKTHDMHISVEIPKDRELIVSGIEDRLVQVYRNLISNALSFTSPGGRLILKAERLNGSIITEVLDEGPGIPVGSEKDIFLRFYSERPRQEEFGEHSGLGLSISKQIVEAHDGDIYAENRLGTNGEVIGARFVVRLPAE